MKFNRTVLLVLMVLAVLLNTGCVRVETGDSRPTIGEQIVDLVKAREIGAISEEEFHQMRRRVMSTFDL